MISDYLHTTSLYADPTFPYTMFQVTSESITPPGPGYRYLHWHEDLQYTLVTHGELSVQVNGIDYHLSCGDAIFINSGHLHIIQELTPGGTYVSFNFPSKLLSFFPDSQLEQQFVSPYLSGYPYSILQFSAACPAHHHILQLLTQLVQQSTQPDTFGSPYRICIQLTELWYETITLFRTIPVKPDTTQSKKQEYLHLMLSYIHQNYTMDISLNDIASAAHVSESECNRCFKNTLHTTPYEYLLHFRITKSTELLQETNDSISQIANKIGFNDSSHFIQYFKKIHHLTPGQYRKKNRWG